MFKLNGPSTSSGTKKIVQRDKNQGTTLVIEIKYTTIFPKRLRVIYFSAVRGGDEA